MTNRFIGWVLLAFSAIFGIWAYNNLIYHQAANEIVVVQSPVDGDLSVSFSPGIHWLCGGHVTRYPRRGQVDFDGEHASDGALHVPPVKVLFNDGGSADLYGSLAWEMPAIAANVIQLHKLYGSPEAIESQVIVKNINKAIFVTGPLMSSAESYSSRRNDLLSLVYDQIEHGAFKTSSRDVQTTDSLTGQPRIVRLVEIATGTNGLQEREDHSIIEDTGLHTFNFTLNDVEYSDAVKAQIATQQQSVMAVQTAIAKAKTAEQDAITIEQQGKANAAQAKWEQETVKAKEVTVAEKNLAVATLTAMADQTNAIIQAQKELDVATLDAQAAEQTKKAAILRGEGQAQAAQLVMAANGALEQKLQAYVEVNRAYADAIAKYQGNWVPQTVLGGAAGGTANGANELVTLLTAKTARDLTLDLSTGSTHSTAGH